MSLENASLVNEQTWAHVFRTDYGRLLSVLMTHANDIQLAEDVLQEAFIQAMEAWPDASKPDEKTSAASTSLSVPTSQSKPQSESKPNNMCAWLLTVARRRLIDRFRRQSFLHDKLHVNEGAIQAITESLHPHRDAINGYSDSGYGDEHESDQPIPDERLKLIFTCCHPALSKEARVALTLKTLCGLSAREIARAYLVSETTMNQRLTRAKRKIKRAGIAYAVPDSTVLHERLPSVLSVIYLIYNESYSAFEGQTLTRKDLAREAIRLAYILRSLLPRPEVSGLLALVLFHDARREARSRPSQPFIPLEEQDRSLWDQPAITEARTILLTAMAEGKPDTYQIQAAISALHSQAARWEDTDWKQIELLYGVLYQIEPSPVVRLNQAVAIAHAGRLNHALHLLHQLEQDLPHYQPFYAARAHVAQQLSEHGVAVADYDKAIKLSKNFIERDYLILQKKRLLLSLGDSATKDSSE